MTNDTTQSIMQSAKRFLSGTMLSRISGLARDVSMAYAFGTTSIVAAFLVAFRFSHLLRRLFGEGALQAAFIPQFEHLRNEDPKRAANLFRQLTYSLCLLLLIIIIFTMASLIIALNFFNLSPGNQEILYLTIIMMPSLFFICLYGLNAALLQCHKNYFTSGVAPVAFNCIWILAVIFIWPLPEAFAMSWLSCAVIIACLAQWLITLPKTRTILQSYGTDNLQLHFFSSDVKLLLKPLLLGLIGVAASQINNALDAVFARYADSEGPAFLWYAIRLQQLPLALFGIAISGALLPPLARAIKNQDFPKYKSFLDFTLRRSMAFMLPISGALFVLGDSCINLIYGHGDFGAESITGTSICLWGYGIGLVPMTWVLILAPAFYAQNNYKIPAIASSLAMSLNVFLNGVLILVFSLGAGSVALATSVSATLNVIYLAFSLQKKMDCLNPSSLWQSFLSILFVTFVAMVAVITTDHLFFQGHTPWQILTGRDIFYAHETYRQLWRLAAQSLIFSGTLFTTAWMIKCEDLLGILRSFFQEKPECC